MSDLPGAGSMVSILAGEETARAAIAPHADALSIAAINGPEQVVISGIAAAVDEIATRFLGDSLLPIGADHQLVHFCG